MSLVALKCSVTTRTFPDRWTFPPSSDAPRSPAGRPLRLPGGRGAWGFSYVKGSLTPTAGQQGGGQDQGKGGRLANTSALRPGLVGGSVTLLPVARCRQQPRA